MDKEQDKEQYICVAPNMTAKTRLREQGKKSVTVRLGFELDGHSIPRFRYIEVLPDPVFDLFEDGVRVVDSEFLTLTVTSLFSLKKGNYSSFSG